LASAGSTFAEVLELSIPIGSRIQIELSEMLPVGNLPCAVAVGLGGAGSPPGGVGGWHSTAGITDALTFATFDAIVAAYADYATAV
jgi:hypothetical protein